MSKVINISDLNIELGVATSIVAFKSSLLNAVAIRYIDADDKQMLSHIGKPTWLKVDDTERRLRVVKVRVGQLTYRLLPMNIKEEMVA